MPDAYIIQDNGRKYTLEMIRDFGLTGLSTQGDEGSLTPQSAYQRVGWYKRCVDVRGRSLASLPWAVYSVGAEEALWIDDGERPDSLAWLNLRDALYTAETSCVLTGAAYALKERMGRRMTSLYWYNAATITPEFQGGEIVRFKRMVPGFAKPEYIDAKEMLAVFSADAYTEMGPGASDALAALMSAQVLYDLDSYTSENLRSGLVNKTIFVAEGRRPAEDEAQRVESWLTRFIYGRRRTEVKVMGGGLKPAQMGTNLSDLSHKELSEQHREAIATALGVPHSLVMSNAANFATAQADQLNFMLTTILPEARAIEDAFNQQLFEPMGLYFCFEPDRSEVMQAQQVMEAEATTRLYVAGILDKNESRARLGYDPVEEEAPPPPTAPVQPMDDDQDEDDDQPLRALDLRRWRAKVQRRGVQVKFTPEALSEDEADVIRERLLTGVPVDDAFSPPFVPESF